jgi:hypothetical protein
MPIEDAARDAAKNVGPALEAPRKTVSVTNPIPNDEWQRAEAVHGASGGLSPVETVMKAQRDYIRAQTQYRHDRSGDRLLEAQDAYIEQLHQFYESMAML